MSTSQIPSVEFIPTSRLLPRKFNPNKMSRSEYRSLVLAIDKLGFLQPLLVRPHPRDLESYEVIDGAHRLKAARELKLEQIPCVRRDTSNPDASALQIGMNKNRGAIDLSAASTAVAELAADGWSLQDIAVTGFSEEEIGDLLKSVNADAEAVLRDVDVSEPEVTTSNAKAHILEVEFNDRESMQKAKRALRRAAGKGAVLGDGLLRLIEDE